MAGLTIGKVAERAGVKVDTLLYCERQGVIAPPECNGSNYRVYTQDALLRVRFVKRAQDSVSPWLKSRIYLSCA